MDSIKLAAFLARAGIAARRRSEELILAGKVKVNGQVQSNVATRVVPGQDVVEYGGKKLELVQEKVLLALNKPRGVVSTVSDPDGKKTVMDFIPKQYQHLRLFPVGRMLPVGGRVAILLPSYKIGKHTLTVSKTLQDASMFGFTIVEGPYRAGRPDAVTQRNVYVFEKNAAVI